MNRNARMASMANWIGFDDITRELLNVIDNHSVAPSYPPYNIKKSSDTKYVLEIAVAGFKKEELEVVLDKDKLTVSGASKKKEEGVTYIHHGLAARSFVRSFTIAKDVEIGKVNLEDGVLSVEMNRIVPDSQKPKKIEIGGNADPQFLQE